MRGRVLCAVRSAKGNVRSAKPGRRCRSVERECVYSVQKTIVTHTHTHTRPLCTHRLYTDVFVPCMGCISSVIYRRLRPMESSTVWEAGKRPAGSGSGSGFCAAKRMPDVSCAVLRAGINNNCQRTSALLYSAVPSRAHRIMYSPHALSLRI